MSEVAVVRIWEFSPLFVVHIYRRRFGWEKIVVYIRRLAACEQPHYGMGSGG